MNDCTVVDIFCGVGGLTHGFVLEGFRVAAGLDLDTSCRYAFEANNKGAKFIPESVDAEDIAERLRGFFPEGKRKILVGCAPCQPYSSNNTRGIVGDRWKLLNAFADLVDQLDPDIISMENVTRLRTFEGGKVFRRFVDRLKKRGYTVSCFDAYCPDYGIPQRRTRLVLFASKFGTVTMTGKTHNPDRYPTVRQALGKLAPITAGIPSEDDPMHWSAALSTKNLQRIRASKPGGTWRDWNPDLVADCHQKPSGETFPSVYGRMEWDAPAPTVTTQFFGFGNGRFGHPEQDRAISLREGAILQNFPRKYKFVKPGSKPTFENLGRQIGNAVPVGLGQAIARSIRHHLKSV